MRRHLPLLVALLACSSASARQDAAPCGPPFPGRTWGSATAGPKEADGSQTFYYPPPPRLVQHADDIGLWARTYALTVVRTSPGVASDTVTRGTLWLRPSPGPSAFGLAADNVLPLVGATTVDLSSLGPVSLAHSPADTSLLEPGVQVFMDQPSGGVTLWLGNSFTRKGSSTDAGVQFIVFAADSSGLRGWWRDGGLLAPTPEGYFCAARQTAT